MIWRAIPSFEGLYEVSDEGQVRSLDRVVRAAASGTQVKKGMVLRQGETKKGYLTVYLSKENRKTTARVHQLVAAAFIGPCPEGMEIGHKDDVRKHNHFLNLEYVTHAENVAQRNERGRQARGLRNKKSKLRPEYIHEIRSALKSGASLAAIGRKYGVTFQSIAAVRDGLSWAHV